MSWPSTRLRTVTVLKRNRAEAVKIDGQVSPLCGGNDNRHYEAASARPARP